MGSSIETLLFGEVEVEGKVESPDDSLSESEYICPKCGKTYRSVFLMKPVNYNCFDCYRKKG